MNINCLATLKALNGDNATNQHGQPILIGDLLLEALLLDDVHSDATQRVSRYKLSQRVYKCTHEKVLEDLAVMEISAEEAVLLKELVAKKFGNPLVLGQLWELLA